VKRGCASTRCCGRSFTLMPRDNGLRWPSHKCGFVRLESSADTNEANALVRKVPEADIGATIGAASIYAGGVSGLLKEHFRPRAL
jgi:hypothetical protein